MSELRDSVSVVMPAFKASETIGEALSSIAAQTWCPAGDGRGGIEAVIVDDASTDGTVEAVEAWLRSGSYRVAEASQHQSVWLPGPDASRPLKRIVILRRERNGGPAMARNAGMAIATGRWVAFLDADDVWCPHRLAVQFDYLSRHADARFLCGLVRTLRPHQQCTPITVETEGFSAGPLPLSEFAVRNPVATSTVLVDRNVLHQAGGFDLRFCGPEDYDMWMRIARITACHKLDVELAWYRFVPGSLSQDDRMFLPQVLRVLQKAFRTEGALASYAVLKWAALTNQYVHASWMAFERRAKRRAILLGVVALGYGLLAREGVRHSPARTLVRYVAGMSPGKEALVFG